MSKHVGVSGTGLKYQLVQDFAHKEKTAGVVSNCNETDTWISISNILILHIPILSDGPWLCPFFATLAKKKTTTTAFSKQKLKAWKSSLLMLDPSYLSIYLSIELESSGASLPISPTNKSNFGVQIPFVFLCKFRPKEKVPPKLFTPLTISQNETKTTSIISKCSFQHFEAPKFSHKPTDFILYKCLFIFFVFCPHVLIQETIKAPPCGSPGPELHFPVLASQVPSSCAQLLASFFQWREWHWLLGGSSQDS